MRSKDVKLSEDVYLRNYLADLPNNLFITYLLYKNAPSYQDLTFSGFLFIPLQRKRIPGLTVASLRGAAFSASQGARDEAPKSIAGGNAPNPSVGLLQERACIALEHPALPFPGYLLLKGEPIMFPVFLG